MKQNESEKIQTKLKDHILEFRKHLLITKKSRHDIIQNTAKERKQTKIVNGFDTEGRIIQGPELQRFLFEEMTEKFNPGRTEIKIIQSANIHVEFLEFKRVLSYMNDKKALGCDSLPILLLKRLGL